MADILVCGTVSHEIHAASKQTPSNSILYLVFHDSNWRTHNQKLNHSAEGLRKHVLFPKPVGRIAKTSRHSRKPKTAGFSIRPKDLPDSLKQSPYFNTCSMIGMLLIQRQVHIL